MIDLKDAGHQEEYIHLARQALIKARIARQKATITLEFAVINPFTHTLDTEVQTLLDEAKSLRKEAQEILKKIEIENGKLFLADLHTFPLKDYLVGKFFKAWKEFDAEYAKIGAPLFGSDPE